MAIDTQEFRRTLEEERRRVVAAIEYLHEENPGSIEDETDEVARGVDNHLAETATVTLDREIDYTLEENEKHVLQAIDAALARIDAGTFGVCANCGREIPEERLHARPFAMLCIDCQRREERR